MTVLPRHHRRLLPAVLAASAMAVPSVSAPAKAAAAPAPVLLGVRCVPATAAGCSDGVTVAPGRRVQLRGLRLAAGMRVTFRWAHGAVATVLSRGPAGWVAVVPRGVPAGAVTVRVRDALGRRSNAKTFTALAPVARPPASAPLAGNAPPAAFAGDGMWIWEMPSSDGGNVAAIAARARRAGIGTVFVKAADGTHTMAQYSPQLVRSLHRAGLRACAWQFVYGTSPRDEAKAATAAVGAGADCLVIDAEASYEGRYAAAQKYMSTLRAAVGRDYPLGLTSFPYVDYHPELPFSVFLAPGGAQVNLPQVYWKAIGGGVDVVSAHALVHNRIYGAPITPIGQTYESPSPAAVRRFRSLWAGWGAHGLSWWSWQSTDATRWRVLSEPAPAPAVVPDPGWPTLRQGAKGDEVIWLQQHLSATYPQVKVTGRYDNATGRAVRRLQAAGRLKVTGATDGPTWTATLKLPFTATDWTAKTASSARARASAARGELLRVDAPPAGLDSRDRHGYPAQLGVARLTPPTHVRQIPGSESPGGQ